MKYLIIILVLLATVAIAKVNLSIKLGLDSSVGSGPSASQAFVDSDGKYLIDSASEYLIGATP